MEAELGKDLFIRSGRKIELTEDGKEFLKYAARFLSILEEGLEKISLLRETKSGVVNLVVSENAAKYILPKVLRNFNDTFPQIQLKLRAYPDYQVLDQVSSGKAELGVTDNIVGKGGFSTISWFKNKLCSFVAPSHPLAEKEQLNPEDLMSYPIIHLSSNSQDVTIIHQWLNARNLKARMVADIKHVEIINKVLVQLQAIYLLPQIAVTRELQKKLFKIPLSPAIELQWDTSFIYKHNLQLSFAAKTFLEFSCRYINELIT